MVDKKATFVLLVTLHEAIARSARAWRNSADRWVFHRLSSLIRSFIFRFDLNDLFEFIIVCPAKDLGTMSNYLDWEAADDRFRVISEDRLAPFLSQSYSSRGEPGLEGWVLQQIVKLAVAPFIQTEFYITLDTDIICTRSFCLDDLVKHDRAVTNVECAADYAGLYTSQFAEEEIERKRFRYRASAALIGYERPASSENIFYGETPVVLNRSVVLRLLHWIGHRAGKPWWRALMEKDGWTEYGLYFQFLEMKQEIQSHCLLSGPNTILDLRRSIWQESRFYRGDRNYDKAHFVDNSGKDVGIFLAVQSWLRPGSWLPPGMTNVGEFYRHLNEWLFKESSHSDRA